MLRWVWIVLPLAGCMQELPGELVGSFEVRGLLDSNGCGEQAVPAFESFQVGVEVREDADGRAYWVRDDSPTVQGVATEAGRVYSFRADGRISTAVPNCVLSQVERVSVELAEAKSDTVAMTLAGENTVDIGATSGSDCRALLAAFGGPFLALPCTLRYTLESDGESQ